MRAACNSSRLPEHWASMIRRIENGMFQIVGLPIDVNDPTFRYRDKAEDWLAERLPDLAPRMKRGYRPCMSCQSTFLSEGPHNRRCDPCRGVE